jgi:hypothetical protein
MAKKFAAKATKKKPAKKKAAKKPAKQIALVEKEKVEFRKFRTLILSLPPEKLEATYDALMMLNTALCREEQTANWLNEGDLSKDPRYL